MLGKHSSAHTPHRAALAGALLLCVFASVGCGRRSTARTPSTPAKPARASTVPAPVGAIEEGEASWYGNPYHGRRTASGEVYDMEQLTAAHRSLPFQTWVEVTNLRNGRQVDVRITDRGPFIDGRIIDLSLAAARAVDMVRAGVVPVRLRIIDPPQGEVKSVSETRPSTDADATDSPAASAANPRTEAAITEPEIVSDAKPEVFYAVQAGAFADRNRAAAFRDRLPFADARLVLRESEPPLWRVVVGSKLTLDGATALAAEVERSSGEAFVVRDR